MSSMDDDESAPQAPPRRHRVEPSQPWSAERMHAARPTDLLRDLPEGSVEGLREGGRDEDESTPGTHTGS